MPFSLLGFFNTHFFFSSLKLMNIHSQLGFTLGNIFGFFSQWFEHNNIYHGDLHVPYVIKVFGYMKSFIHELVIMLSIPL